MSSSDVRYHFGPRDRRGLLLGVRLGQIAILGTGAFVGMIVLLGAHDGAGGVLALLLVVGVTATAAFVPISGRALDEWLPAVLHFLLHGRRTWRSPQPGRGQVLRTMPGGEARVLAEQPAFPPVLRDCSILAVPVPRGELGVVKDARRGTWTAVLRVRGTSFALTDSGEKARRMGAWGAVQSSLARRGTPISALQLVVRTLAEDPDALARHLAEQRTLDLHSPIVRSYLTLLDDAAPVAEAQEVQVLVALQVSLRSAGQQIPCSPTRCARPGTPARPTSSDSPPATTPSTRACRCRRAGPSSPGRRGGGTRRTPPFTRRTGSASGRGSPSGPAS
jgi:hypothetical protein